MKKIQIVLTSLMMLAAMTVMAQIVKPVSKGAPYKNAQPEVDPETAPVVTFDKTTHDFGTINEGDRVETTFKFTNTGKSPLIISKIRSSCGCTVPSGWKKEPIQPGESGEFKVIFNSRHKPHKQRKTITMYCNTVKGREMVHITANVIPDPEMEKIRKERRERKLAEAKKRREEQIKAKNNPSQVAKPKATTAPHRTEKDEMEARKRDIEMKRQLHKEEMMKIEKRKKDMERKKREDILKKEEHKVKRVAALEEKKAKEELKAAELKKKNAERERQQMEKQIRDKEKEAKMMQKEKAKLQKAQKKEAKKAEKEAKRVAKIDKKLSKLKNKRQKLEKKMMKQQHKMDRLDAKGKLAPADKEEMQQDIKEMQQKIDEYDLDIKHLKDKL